MKHARKMCIFLMACMICMGAVIVGTPKDVQARKMVKGVYWLNNTYYEGDAKLNHDSYSGADVTGDGKKDNVETIRTSNTLVLYVNGIAVKKWNTKTTYVDLSDIEIVTLKNKKSYLSICEFRGRAKGKTICRLYQVRKGKLVTAFDFEKIFDKKLLTGNDFIYRLHDYDEKDSDDSFQTLRVSKNTLYVDLFITTKSLGQITIRNLRITYSKGKLRLGSGSYKAELAHWSWADNDWIKYYTAAKRIQTVKSPGSSKKGIVLKKNMQFNLKKISFYDKNIYAQVKTKNNKTGWIKLSTSGTSLVKKRSTIDYRG